MKTQPWWIIVCFVLGITSAHGYDDDDGTVMKHPISVYATRVIDGDSIVISAHIWISLYQETVLRLAHANAPEIRGMCPEERAKAEEALQFVKRWIEGSSELNIHDVQQDRFGGRVVGRIVNERNQDLGQLLLAHQLARSREVEYHREYWCDS